MSFTHTITGATDRSSIVRGDVGLVSGTWASAVSGTTGTIVTGGSVILTHGVTMGSAGATGTAKIMLSSKNKTINASTHRLASENGTIAITELDPSNGEGGDWWAIVTV